MSTCKHCGTELPPGSYEDGTPLKHEEWVCIAALRTRLGRLEQLIAMMTKRQWAGPEGECPWCRSTSRHELHQTDCDAAIACGWSRKT
jgi:hypothetical protein